MAKGTEFSRESAEKLAISALGFLAQDPERLGQFLSVTGIGPDMIRKAAADPSFLAGVLDHVGGDEALLLAVAEHAGVRPQELERAQAALNGQRWEREMP
jgi:Protein of unknown function (DUF3572)